MKMPSSCRSRWVAGPSGVSKSAIGESGDARNERPTMTPTIDDER